MKFDNRSFRKLRISLTDTCNLACTYCVPETLRINHVSNSNLHLKTNEYLKLVEKINTNSPIKKVRLTGGEPLLYIDIQNLIKGLKELGIPEVSITTNGLFLEKLISNLKRAGLNSINVSLDALTSDLFLKMTRRPGLQKVLNGIEAALNEGVELKINTVILKGLNETQINPLINFGIEKGITVRFLELMKMGYLHHNFHQYFVSQVSILKTVSNEFKFYKIKRELASTATYWEVNNMNYQFGVIANETQPFCSDCDRLRLDSYGNIFGCISASKGINILPTINSKASITPLLEQAKAQKQSLRFIGSELSMQYLGG